MSTINNVSGSHWIRTVLYMFFIVIAMMVAREAWAEVDGGGGGGGGGGGNADNKVTVVLCNAITLFQGGVGKSIAIIVMISIAIMMFLGKITWGVAIAVAVGMGLMFGAESVVQFASGDNAAICTNTGGNANALT